MYATQKRNPTIGLGVTTAMAAVMLSGCASSSGPRADVSVSNAQASLAVSEHDRAVQTAEGTVMADPRNAAHRLALGNAYLEAGRFASASASFEDAMTLGDNSPRAALSLSLALIGQARFAEAASLLNDWEGEIAASDLGLALALSGQPERGIHILSNAIRGGENTVKSRQNLAYAYAVAGRWREARMMVAQDVPAHEVGARISEWAQLTNAEAYQARIAGLLGVPANVRDTGQPVHLALANTPVNNQLAANQPVAAANGQFATFAPELAALDAGRMNVPATGSELPSVGAPREQDTPQVGLDPYHTERGATATGFAQAFTPAAPATGSATVAAEGSPRSAGQPVSAAARTANVTAPRGATSTNAPAATRPALATAPARSAANAPAIGTTHLVQLGSFSSEAGAKRAWGIYVSRYPELADREMVITQAVVNGRNYWRVSAGGFDRAGSRSMCSIVDSANGDGCISWAANSPLPGAIDNGTRLARR